MTLARQTISIPLGRGESDAAARPLEEGNTEAKNVSFVRTGRARKRPAPIEMPGIGEYDAKTLPSGTLNSIHDVSGVPVVLAADFGASWLDAYDGWKGLNLSAPSVAACVVRPTVRTAEGQYRGDIAINGTTLRHVWDERFRGDGSVWECVYDLNAGKLDLVIGPRQVMSGYSSLGNPRIFAVGTGFIVVCTEAAGSLVVYGSASSAIGSFTSNGTLGSGTTFNACTDGTHVYVNRGSDTHKVTSATVTTLGGGGIAIYYDANQSRVYTLRASMDIYRAPASFASSFVAHATYGQDTDTDAIYEIAQWNGSGGIIVLSSAASDLSTVTINESWGVRWETFNASGTLLDSGKIPNAMLLAKPKYITSLSRPVFALRDGYGQRGYLAHLDADTSRASCIAQFSDSISVQGISTAMCGLPSTMLDENGAIIVPHTVATQQYLGSLLMQTDLAFVSLTAPPARSVGALDGRFVATGAGLVTLEQAYAGCATLPRCGTPKLTNLAREFSGFEAGWQTYGGTGITSVRFAWVWVDHSGREHRGAPSEPLDVATGSFLIYDAMVSLPVGWPSRCIAVPLPVLAEPLSVERGVELFLDTFLSDVDAPEPLYWVSRTKPQVGASYLDCVLVTVGPMYVGDDDTITNVAEFVLAYSDNPTTQIAWFEAEIEPVPTPSLADVCSTQSRVWALPASERNKLLVSKPLNTVQTPEFAPEIEITIPSEGGPCVAIAAIDDKVVVFKERSIFIVVGDPGDSYGEGSTVQTPRRISSDVGCVCAQSVVEGPFGVAFQSQRGFYTLSRGLDLRFVGEPVQARTPGASRGLLVPDESTVRWLCATSQWPAHWAPSSDALVWDYLRDQWSYWDGYSMRDHCVTQGEVMTIDSALPYYESVTVYDDASFGSSVTSPWIKVSGVQGFQRVWRIAAHMYHYTGHVSISIAYDYEPSFQETIIFEENALDVEKSSGGSLDLSVRPARQKCEAIQVRVSELLLTPGDNPVIATPGRGIEVTSIDLEIGTKSGTVRRRLVHKLKG